VSLSSALVAGTFVEGPNKDGQPYADARVVVDSTDVVSRLEATFICLVPHG
jgi:hypothetical protein